jgi:acetylcholinesterase
MLKFWSAAALLGAVYAQQSATTLPTVDLGYEVYRAAGFNVRILTNSMGTGC